MKIFIDTADINQIQRYLNFIDGVTTNPSLIAKTGKKFEDVILQIAKIIDGPISAEVISTDSEEMVSEARKLAKLHHNIVVKLPLTEDGLNATKKLHGLGIKTNVTLCFSANQALLAAKANATYISPFIGRLDDIGHDGIKLITEIRAIYNNYHFKTMIISASIRHPLHIIDSALAGADVATVPPEILSKMISHPLTDSGLAKFLEDWKRVPK